MNYYLLHLGHFTIGWIKANDPVGFISNGRIKISITSQENTEKWTKIKSLYIKNYPEEKSFLSLILEGEKEALMVCPKCKISILRERPLPVFEIIDENSYEKERKNFSAC